MASGDGGTNYTLSWRVDRRMYTIQELGYVLCAEIYEPEHHRDATYTGYHAVLASPNHFS